MKYIKCIKDTVLLTAGKWYGINKLNFYSAFVMVFRPSDNDWVMSDKENFDMGSLLDHNPDLENETQPITKDNILNVLKHNGYNESTLEAYCELCIRNSTAYYGAVMLNNVPNWIGAVEAIVGKLKPLPKLEEIELKVGDKIKFINNDFESTIDKFNYAYRRIYLTDDSYWGFECIDAGVIKSVNGKSGIYRIPEFNFERYLLDNGFKAEQTLNGVTLKYSAIVAIYKSESLTAGKWTYREVYIQETLQSADILIAMAKLAEGLK